MQTFVDREEELSYLEELYSQGKAQMVIIYGRRRIGKTELVKKFMEGKRAIYFYAMRQDLRLEIERLAEIVSKTLNRYIKPDLDEIFGALAESGKIVFVIDEFTYWIEEDPKALSILQRVWDEYLSRSGVFLILVASAATLVERSTSYGGALHGRRTGQWRLDELEPKCLKDFLPKYSNEDLVRVYGCAGGVPHYLASFDPHRSFEDNVNRLFFHKGGFLYEEAENLLRYEVRDPYAYINIVRAIEEGASSYSEIADKARINITSLSKYLWVLEKMGIVERIKPVLGKARPIYFVRDNYIRFWVRFVYPNRISIELGTHRFQSSHMESYLPSVFEEMVRRSLKHLRRKGILPFLGVCGRYWEKDAEVDVLCLNKDRILALEVKWTELSSDEAEEILRDLRRKLGYKEGIYGVAAKRIIGDLSGIKIELADLF